MRVSIPRLLLLGSIVLVLFPLAISKPGLPPTMKADEPAYYLAALSLARDGDLRLEVEDIARLPQEFPILPVSNLIVMTDDDWETVYYGKPYIYSLLAAPAAALAGGNGMLAFNMAMCALMIWLGFVYLRRFNDESMAALFSVGFFVMSASFAYNYWLHPEVFNMLSAMLCLFFAFYEPRDEYGGAGLGARLLSDSMLPIWSGAALAFGTYNKPMLVAFALPALFRFVKRGGLMRTISWGAAFIVAMGVICGVSIAFTGHASAYLGVDRTGIELTSFYAEPEFPVGLTLDEDDSGTNDWSWLARVPDVDWKLLRENTGYFFVGRHTGLFPYLPFSLVALIFFAIGSRRSVSRWLTLAATASIALYFLIFIFFNWHGGGGFVGNRYFVIAYPAFLFLVTRIRPGWLTGFGWALGVLFMGVILVTPFGAPVRQPTLQSHVRGKAFSMLPMELSLTGRVPGYRGLAEGGLWFWGRKDVFDVRGYEFWVHGATPVEIWVEAGAPVEELVFRVENPVQGWNRVEIKVGGDRQVLEFDDAIKRKVALHPTKPYTIRSHRGEDRWVYRMVVETARLQRVSKQPTGAQFMFLGTRDLINEDVFSIAWRIDEPPQAVVAGAPFRLDVKVRNSSEAVWRSAGTTQTKLSYRWLTEDGSVVGAEGPRTAFRRNVRPGQSTQVFLDVEPPEAPGSYILELDAVRERVSWFSKRNPDTVHRIAVEVTPTPPI